MQLKYLNSATVIVSNGKKKVLCDPWLKDGAYYGSWCHYPPLNIDISDYFDVDYIYISHVHPDHLNVDTLKLFPKNIPILIHNYEQKFVFRILNMLGFTNIIEIDHKKEFYLDKYFSIEILAADNCNAEKCGLFIGCISKSKSGKSQSIDSLAVFKSKNSVLVNTNDCPFEMTTGVLKYIKDKYKNIDMLLTGYLGAGPYPQCFPKLNKTQKKEAAEEKKEFFYLQALNFVQFLNPRYFMPFAGKYTLSGRLINLNQWKGNPEMEEVIVDLKEMIDKKGIESKMIVLSRFTQVDILDHNIISNYTFINEKEKKKYISEKLAKVKFTYEQEDTLNKRQLEKLLTSAQSRKLNMQSIYNYYSDWTMYLDIEQDFLIKIYK